MSSNRGSDNPLSGGLSISEEEITESEKKQEEDSTRLAPASPIPNPRKARKRSLSKHKKTMSVPVILNDSFDLDEIEDFRREPISATYSKTIELDRDGTIIETLPQSDHEFLGLVKEVPLEKSVKKKARGKVRKRPPAVNFDTAVEVIRIPRENIRFFGEGNFPEDVPSEIEEIISEEDYVQSIKSINEVIANIPTMRTGLLFIPPTIVISLIMLCMVLLFSSPPFVGLMIMFGFWCTGVVGIVCGFAIYYVFQREVFAAVAKEDIKLFHKGIRLATKIQDSKALYVVVEGGEDRDD